MSYLDTYVIPVPTSNLDAYRRLSKTIAKVWLDHGALEYKDYIADDVKPGKRTSFPRSVKLKPDETVVVCWTIYKSRAQRDRVNAAAMQDPRLAPVLDPKAMPFDGKRMFMGGFKPLSQGGRRR